MAGKQQKNQIVSRLRQLRQTMREKGLDGFVATSPQDVSYLSGFSGYDSYLLVTGRGAALITDSRYLEQARQECSRLAVIQRKGSMAVAVAHRAKRGALNRIGFEPAGLSLATYRQLGKAIGQRKLIDAQGLVSQMRIRKDGREQGAIRRAIKVAEEAFLIVLEELRPGITELELAGRLDLEMKLRGASEPAFSTIVTCGAKSSMPHARPGKGRIRAKQPVLIDWGATVDGYRSDLTRVVFLDSMPQSLRAPYQSVLEASRAGLEAVKPGVSAERVDEAARAAIRKAGYGKYFGHGLGHGIGRNVHEAPSISQRSRDVLEEGMIFTIEPGIYLPGKGGIRIENDVLVTKRGYRVLSSLPDKQKWAVRK